MAEKLSAEQVVVIQETKTKLLRDLAYLEYDKVTNELIGVYPIELHQQADLVALKVTADTNYAKAKQLALEQAEKAKKALERQCVISAYQLLSTHLLIGKVEYEGIDSLTDWLESYLSGIVTTLPIKDSVFMGYYNKVRGSL